MNFKQDVENLNKEFGELAPIEAWSRAKQAETIFKREYWFAVCDYYNALHEDELPVTSFEGRGLTQAAIRQLVEKHFEKKGQGRHQ